MLVNYLGQKQEAASSYMKREEDLKSVTLSRRLSSAPNHFYCLVLSKGSRVMTPSLTDFLCKFYIWWFWGGIFFFYFRNLFKITIWYLIFGYTFFFISQVWIIPIIWPKYPKEQYPLSSLKLTEHDSFNTKILCCKTESITASIKSVKKLGPEKENDLTKVHQLLSSRCKI